MDPKDKKSAAALAALKAVTDPAFAALQNYKDKLADAIKSGADYQKYAEYAELAELYPLPSYGAPKFGIPQIKHEPVLTSEWLKPGKTVTIGARGSRLYT